jgi:hypothetical protein
MATGLEQGWAPKTEQEWAAWYQAHKDDPDFLDNFGEVVPPPPDRPRRRLGARISVSFTPDELDVIRAKSHETCLSYVEVVKQAVLSHLQKPGDPP